MASVIYFSLSSFCRYSRHEEAISKLAKEMGFSHVSLSSHVMPMVRMVPRGYTGIAYSVIGLAL